MPLPDSASDDGATDHNGELLPELSGSAKKMKMVKLLKTPMPTFGGSTPGSWFWTNAAYFLLYRVNEAQFRTTEVSGTEKIPTDRGTLCTAWHTNGLMDPLGIMLNHPKKFVMGGRHDLVTRPMLGWWTRKLAVQPVVRKAELLRGGCSEEEANHLNGRSLLTLATGVSSGFGCVLFPEGTSHDLSHMLRYRTGPFRTVLAAGAIAKSQGKPLPAIAPVGLHFRKRHLFRTDQWIEFEEPIHLEDSDIPDDLVEAVSRGDWVEPPAESVHALRDRVRQKLELLTPVTNSWNEYDALKLLATMKSSKAGDGMFNWREEVVKARALREEFWQEQGISLNPKPGSPPEEIKGDLMDHAKVAAKILDDNGLDARDLNRRGDELKKTRPDYAVIGLGKLALFTFFLPLTLIALSPQIVLGRLLGDSTDEGVDARSTYQFLAAMFGSLLIWPISATFMTWLALGFRPEMAATYNIDWLTLLGQEQWQQYLMIVICWLIQLPLFWISGHTFCLGWDALSDSRKALTRRFMDAKQKQELHETLAKIHPLL